MGTVMYRTVIYTWPFLLLKMIGEAFQCINEEKNCGLS